jgi:hypothetical protein
MEQFMPDEEPKPKLPAIVRAGIEPFRNIMGAPDKSPAEAEAHELALERTLVKHHSRPTDDQLRTIGRVATTFSVLERIIGFTLARLALAPDFPTMAITKEIGVNYSLKAMGKLLALHKRRYRSEIAAPELLAELEKTLARIRPLKDERDVMIHTVWIRKSDDILYGLRPRPVTERVALESEPQEKTLAEINGLADRIQETADELFMMSQLLPEIDEIQHAKSLARISQSLRRHTE